MSMFESRKISTMMTQVKLSRKENDNIIETILWLPSSNDIRIGSKIRLKNEPDWWTIIEIYSKVSRSQIQDDWKVGGL